MDITQKQNGENLEKFQYFLTDILTANYREQKTLLLYTSYLFGYFSL